MWQQRLSLFSTYELRGATREANEKTSGRKRVMPPTLVLTYTRGRRDRGSLLLTRLPRVHGSRDPRVQVLTREFSRVGRPRAASCSLSLSLLLRLPWVRVSFFWGAKRSAVDRGFDFLVGGFVGSLLFNLWKIACEKNVVHCRGKKRSGLRGLEINTR